MASATGERPGTRRSRRFLPSTPGLAEPYRLTPQTALRIAVLGAVALGVFGVLFFRLWALQVLSGDRYRNVALSNQVRTRRIPAPRGPILDRNGRPLVTNVAGSAVAIWPADLPRHHRYLELKRLSKVVHVPVAEMAAKIAARKGDLLDPVVIKQGVHEDQVYYVKEHQALFPGVNVAETYIRDYPNQALASQILGYVGEISPTQLKQLGAQDYKPGDVVGQSGVERSYDSYLRGRPGLSQVRVDSLGRPVGQLRSRVLPQIGDSLRLTIDVDLQRAAERALRYGISLAQSQGHYQARGGAIVALDPNDGSVLAMASYPTYKPSLYAGRVDPKKLAAAGLVGKNAALRNFPAIDRVTQALYPAGSTFKPVTALAALEEHVIGPDDLLQCTGQLKIDGHVFKNWNPYADSPMNMETALAASCDTYFYQVGDKFYKLPKGRGQPLQEWASRFGFGKPTGIDVGFEEAGLLPTIGWRHRKYTAKTDRNWEIDRLWKSGDSVQLAIGQKDLLVTPIQMARFYALIANGGSLVTPHVAMDAESNGATVRLFQPPPPKRIDVDPKALNVVRTGLYEATHASFGTTQSVFGHYSIPIAGKTGTAEEYVGEYGRYLDQSWWCGYGPYHQPSIVVCALIENGGHGGTAAAPAALRVFEHWFGRKAPAAQTGNTD